MWEGTTPGMEEAEPRREQRPRATQEQLPERGHFLVMLHGLPDIPISLKVQPELRPGLTGRHRSPKPNLPLHHVDY